MLAPARPAAAAPTLPPVRQVFVIVLENKTFADTFGGPGLANAAYLNNTLVPQGDRLLAARARRRIVVAAADRAPAGRPL